VSARTGRRSGGAYDGPTRPHSATDPALFFSPPCAVRPRTRGDVGAVDRRRATDSSTSKAARALTTRRKGQQRRHVRRAEHGARGSMVLAAETVEHEVFPGLKLKGSSTSTSPGSHQWVDDARVRDVQRRPSLHAQFSKKKKKKKTKNKKKKKKKRKKKKKSAKAAKSIRNHLKRVQKLCYNNALIECAIARRLGLRAVARQRTSAGRCASRSPGRRARADRTRANVVGSAIVRRVFESRPAQVIQLAKLIASRRESRSPGQVRTTSTNFREGGLVLTTTPALEGATLHDFLVRHRNVAKPKDEAAKPPRPPPNPGGRHAHRSSRRRRRRRPRAS